MLAAVLWDVDGTLAETERDGHLVAFNQAFAALGVPWRWSAARYAELLAVAGGRERLLHDMQQQSDAPAFAAARAQLAAELHRLKNELYARIVRGGGLALRAGVKELMADCERAGVRMAIATTTSGANAAELLAQQLGANWRSRFAAVVCAEQAPRKKPDPQVYQRALALLGLQAAETVAIEDSPAGIQAARQAAVPVVVTRSCYFPHGDAPDALAVGPSLATIRDWFPQPRAGAARIDLDQLKLWHAGEP